MGLGNFFKHIGEKFNAFKESHPNHPVAVAVQHIVEKVKGGEEINEDVILEEIAQAGQKLGLDIDKASIVDLCKAMGIPHDFGSREKMAKELGYASDTSDSAAMNIWLKPQLIKKYAQHQLNEWAEKIAKSTSEDETKG